MVKGKGEKINQTIQFLYFWRKVPVLKPFLQQSLLEAGCDEAGRGCYAGPVFAAAVILPREFSDPRLDDSKKLTAEQRETLRPLIEQAAIAFAVARVEAAEIDRINILKASFLAMHKAIAGLKPRPGLLLIDGNRFSAYPRIAHRCIVKGDGIYASIAAASVLAKTYRDAYMQEIHVEFPQYHWATNKGYGTAEHRQAIEKYGLCIHHRKSFDILPQAPDLFGR
jgi:ribonuclease HII